MLYGLLTSSECVYLFIYLFIYPIVPLLTREKKVLNVLDLLDVRTMTVNTFHPFKKTLIYL